MPTPNFPPHPYTGVPVSDSAAAAACDVFNAALGTEIPHAGDQVVRTGHLPNDPDALALGRYVLANYDSHVVGNVFENLWVNGSGTSVPPTHEHPPGWVPPAPAPYKPPPVPWDGLIPGYTPPTDFDQLVEQFNRLVQWAVSQGYQVGGPGIVGT